MTSTQVQPRLTQTVTVTTVVCVSDGGGQTVSCTTTNANSSTAVSPLVTLETALVLMVAGGGALAFGVKRIFFSVPRSVRTRSKA
jgi:hypothetical protein